MKVVSRTGTSHPIFKFAGQIGIIEDANGLHYMRARYYNTDILRFISRDTYEGMLSKPLSLNNYSYGYNNPFRYVDPSGNTAWILKLGQYSIKCIAALLGVSTLTVTGILVGGYRAYRAGIYLTDGVADNGKPSNVPAVGRGKSRNSGNGGPPSGPDNFITTIDIVDAAHSRRNDFLTQEVNQIFNWTGDDFDDIARNASPYDLITSLENSGWHKVIEDGGSKSGPATILTDPVTGTIVRVHATPGEGAPYFRVQNSGGGYLDSTGAFPSDATRQELRDLTHFYFGN
ncbi:MULTISPECIES: RHS repeat-associated core domain-containing protein [unclassified Fusibacter]|uniref:RHS repeat-associated core domain-containing protein n=1 Tax=unclassified Fusibacter TaxID=2624464 RepID=UPI0010115F9F|nr:MULTISPECIES: RHS repeat-associated core domain-containing protein [unclassified Fusibacter]MCK8058729.1 hypothetical protein [Fusibacter sp. A2]NPE21803.1 hypothetical protein [Fusibacter sp. A1]RXV61375.1 hypothetical protein DWB64_08165 [Fusibacter sp. A1]